MDGIETVDSISLSYAVLGIGFTGTRFELRDIQDDHCRLHDFSN